MSFDLNILVNGNRCKQYYHQGKTFIEAKNGSEYVIEIKNNYWKRVLAVGSVDGLNVLTGKTASEKDSGYIIGAYSAEKIKGFRFSDDEWAMFKFGYKFYGNTYAQSKEDGSEKNCGVIGLRVFYENEPVYTCNPPVIWNQAPSWLTPAPTPVTPYWVSNPTYTLTASYSCGTGAYQSNVNYTCNSMGQTDMSARGDDTNYSSLFGGCAAAPSSPDMGNLLKEAISDAKAVRATALSNAKSADSLVGKFKKLAGTKSATKGGGQSATLSSDRNDLRDRFNRIRSTAYNQYSCDKIAVAAAPVPTPPEFDMGTEWGRKEHSKVRTIAFDRGCLAQSFEIYYASREALIAMGVPITNELAVNLPQSFPNNYAQPPKGWVG